nr:MAG TPA: hypothetical protein [Crassvirales sp.]
MKLTSPYAGLYNLVPLGQYFNISAIFSLIFFLF